MREIAESGPFPAASQKSRVLIPDFSTAPSGKKMVAAKVLHCCGSPVSKYYSMISVHYCRQMLAGASDDDTKASFDFTFAVILPGGAWCLVTDLDQATIDNADKLSHGEALTALVAGDFDVCVPHMFCWPGSRAC